MLLFSIVSEIQLFQRTILKEKIKKECTIKCYYYKEFKRNTQEEKDRNKEHITDEHYLKVELFNYFC